MWIICKKVLLSSLQVSKIFLYDVLHNWIALPQRGNCPLQFIVSIVVCSRMLIMVKTYALERNNNCQTTSVSYIGLYLRPICLLN